jgi:hypothetical protein
MYTARRKGQQRGILVNSELVKRTCREKRMQTGMVCFVSHRRVSAAADADLSTEGCATEPRKKARAPMREEKRGGEARKRARRGEARRGKETGVEAERSAPMRCDGRGCFNAVLREWGEEGARRRGLEGAAGSETRRDETTRGEAKGRAGAGAQRCPHTAQTKQTGALDPDHWRRATGGKTEQPPSPLLAPRCWPVLCSAGGSSRTAQPSEATHMVKSQRARGRGRTRQPHSIHGGFGVRRPSRALWPCPSAAWLAAAKLANASRSDSKDDDRGAGQHKQSGACAERSVHGVSLMGQGRWVAGALWGLAHPLWLCKETLKWASWVRKTGQK